MGKNFLIEVANTKIKILPQSEVYMIRAVSDSVGYASLPRGCEFRPYILIVIKSLYTHT